MNNYIKTPDFSNGLCWNNDKFNCISNQPHVRKFGLVLVGCGKYCNTVCSISIRLT